MPSVKYFNATAPFWDFVASLEEQGASHPFFAGNANRQQAGNDSSDNDNNRPAYPWMQGWAAGPPFGPGAWGASFPHRGRFGPNGPPPTQPAAEGDSPDPPEEVPAEGASEKTACNEAAEHSDGPASCGAGPHHRRHHARGGCRSRGGIRGGGCKAPRAAPWARSPPCAAGFTPPSMGEFAALAKMFHSQLYGDKKEAAEGEDGAASFRPEVDVFDTEHSFVIHVSLPGAKKEDVGVDYDFEKSELSIAGVSLRPADEELLNTLAMDERKVGMFERKVRLGSRASPAQVDVEGITAKLEDGILKVEVPKLSPEEGFVEVRKVDVE